MIRLRLVTTGGEVIMGVRKNEDTVFHHVMDTRENLRMFLKSELREAALLEQSLMPVL